MRQPILGVVMGILVLGGQSSIALAQQGSREPARTIPALPRQAMRFTLTGGTVIQGTRVGEDATFFTVESRDDGLVRVRKTDVAQIELITSGTEDDDDFIDEVASRSSPSRHAHHRRRHHPRRSDPYDDAHFVDEVASRPPPRQGPDLHLAPGEAEVVTEVAGRIAAEIVLRGFAIIIASAGQ